MKRVWEQDELIEHFTFLPNEMQEVGKKTGENRLGFAVLFKFFQYEARFPANKSEVPGVVVEYIARGVGERAGLFPKYDWDGRAMTYHQHPSGRSGTGRLQRNRRRKRRKRERADKPHELRNLRFPGFAG